MKPLHYRIFVKALFASGGIALCILCINAWMGKEALFLWCNGDAGTTADGFFKWWSHMGEEYIWILLFVYLVAYQRHYLVLYFAALIASTLIVQVTKNWLLPNELRPFGAITNHLLIHTVPGIKVHTLGSFPSGHTSSAFTICLLTTLLFPLGKAWPIVLLGALLVGFARVYLAQHFPLDVAAGIWVAIFSCLVAVYCQQRYNKRKKLTNVSK